jgi:hypothetical protein
MSNKLLLLLVSLTLLLFGCVKSTKTTGSDPTTPISEAQAFFNREIASSGKPLNSNNYRARQAKTVLWDRAITRHSPSGDLVVAPVAYKNNLIIASKDAPERAYSLNDLTSLVVSQDSNKTKHAYLVTFVPDTTNNLDSTTGIYFVEDWKGNSILKPVHRRLDGDTQGGPVSGSSGTKQTDIVQTIQVCTEIDGYNYSPDFPDASYSWSETTCSTFGFSTPGLNPSMPYANLPYLALIRTLRPIIAVVSPPRNPIADITDYFKCFTNGGSPDHSYSIQICVDQPTDGSRQAWGLTPGGPAGSSIAQNLVNVGHAFLIFSENDQGHITTRNVGFYPSSMVWPFQNNSSSQGVLANDQSHPYNISLTVNVSNDQFFGILNYASLGNNQGFYYDLNSNNCTTFVINAMAKGGITLPNTKGSWPGGTGNDPGDLGEDIRNMSTSSNMSKNTVANNHPNVGSCD